MTMQSILHEELTADQMCEYVFNAAGELHVALFTPDMVEECYMLPSSEDVVQLRELAEAYTFLYVGTFPFMNDMKQTLRRYDFLTAGQAKGVLNTMLAQHRRLLVHSNPPATAIIQDGMYRVPDEGNFNLPNGNIYKVQWNRGSGDGRRLYAKRLVILSVPTWDDAHERIITPARISFFYVAGAYAALRPEWRMTMAQAAEFGAMYGTCVRCGRTLTREESIARAMGPVCARHFSA